MRPILTLALLALLFVPDAHAQPSLAVALMGFGTPITCDMPQPPPPHDQSWGVFHNDGNRTIQLRPFVCDLLVQARSGLTTHRTAFAVLTVGHELSHFYGVVNESLADCVGMDFMPWVASKLGIKLGTSSTLQATMANLGDQQCQAAGPNRLVPAQP